MSLEALAAEIAADDAPQDPMDGWIFEETPELLPGTDFHDGILYMTVPMSRTEKVKVGRGKNAEEIEQIVQKTMCVTSEHEFFEYSVESLNDRGFRFPTTFTQDNKNRWPLKNLQGYMRSEDEPIDGMKLFNDLRDIYVTHMEFADEIYFDILPLFIMQSYLFRLFKATGYLHFNGTAASGKSQNLRLMKALGFNTIWASSMSEASIFRQTAGCPGIICVDEAESFESEAGKALRQILLAGYLASTSATRAEKVNDRFETIKYLVYSPKVLASIKPLDPVIQSRCVVVQMMPAIRPIPEFDPDHDKWAQVRADLYVWAMQQARDLDARGQDWNERRRYSEAPTLVNRAWQIVQAYVIVADHLGGKEMVDPIIAHFTTYFERMGRAEEETDRQRLLLKVLPRVLHTKTAFRINDDPSWFKLKDIHDVFIDHIDEDVREYYKTRQTTRHLTSLGWKERRQAHGGTMVKLLEDDVRKQFKRRRLAPFDEDLSWLEGEQTYVHEAPQTSTMFSDPPPAEPTASDEYSWVDQLNEPPDSA